MHDEEPPSVKLYGKEMDDWSTEDLLDFVQNYKKHVRILDENFGLGVGCVLCELERRKANVR